MEAFSAVTVINAFATGKGGAIGIDLKVKAKVKLKEGIGGEIFVRGEKFMDFSLVKAVRDVIAEKFNLDFGIKVKINSEEFKECLRLCRKCRKLKTAGRLVTATVHEKK